MIKQESERLFSHQSPLVQAAWTSEPSICFNPQHEQNKYYSLYFCQHVKVVRLSSIKRSVLFHSSLTFAVKILAETTTAYVTSFPHNCFLTSVFEVLPAFNLDPQSGGVWEWGGAAGEVTLNSWTFSLVEILPLSGKFRAFSKFSGRTRTAFSPWPLDTKPLTAPCS